MNEFLNKKQEYEDKSFPCIDKLTSLNLHPDVNIGTDFSPCKSLSIKKEHKLLLCTPYILSG